MRVPPQVRTLPAVLTLTGSGITGRKSMHTKQILTVAIVGLLCAAAGCDDEFNGTYADEANVTRYEFQPDGRAQIHVLGTAVIAEYTLDGDRVLVTSPQGTVVLTRHEDRLYGPMGLELVRQQEQTTGTDK